jgi:hypothetical protein
LGLKRFSHLLLRTGGRGQHGRHERGQQGQPVSGSESGYLNFERGHDN